MDVTEMENIIQNYNPQKVQECWEEFANNIEKFLVDYERTDSLHDAMTAIIKLKEQADYNAGFVLGFLEGEIKDQKEIEANT